MYNEAHDLTLKTYECIIFKNNTLLEQYESEFYAKKERFTYSRGFIFNDLIIAIINIIKNKQLSIDMLKKAENYLSLYDNNVAYIYGVIYCFAKGIKSNLKDSKKVVLDILNSHSNHDILPSVKGMFYYQLGRIFSEEKMFVESNKYYQKAIKMMKEIYCIERVNQINIEIANMLFHLELYQEAESKYLELLEESKKHNFKRRMNVCMSNLSYLYLIQKRYDECELFALRAKKAGSKYPDLNYYLAYCAYKTKSKKNAQRIVGDLIDEEDDYYSLRMMKMIQGFINDNTNKIDTYFERAKNDLIKQDAKFEIKMLYKMVISYYKNKNSNKCVNLVEEYLNLSKF